MLSRVALSLIRVYQVLLSPALHTFSGSGSGCRFHPTCSEYGHLAFKTLSPARAFSLTLRRIFRCHPWSAGGQDPLPHAIPAPQTIPATAPLTTKELL